jgi:ABC-type multidrug transport system fused ATPase/permease subunit
MTVWATIRASLRLLEGRDRRLLGAAVLIQMTTSVLDLAGVALIGLAGALSVTTVSGQPAPERIRTVAAAVGLGDLSDGALVAVLASAAALALLVKSIIAPLLTSRLLRFLARREALVAGRLTRELLSRPLTFVQMRSTQETSKALIRGANVATVVVLGQAAVAASELALLAALAIAMLVINPTVGLGVICFFGAISWAQQRVLGAKASRFGAQRAVLDTKSLQTVQEALGGYREIIVADRRNMYAERLDNLRTRAAMAAAGGQMIAILPKYLSEVALVFGSFALAAVLFSTQPVSVAAGTFALVLAAAVRVMPSLLRLQGAALSIRAAGGPASTTYSLAEDLGYPVTVQPTEDQRTAAARSLRGSHRDFVPRIEVRGASFTYPGAAAPAIRDITLTIEQDRSVALIGRSGAGKSTLADVILGILQPDAGTVTISGMISSDALHRWPGAIAYVPQEVMLFNDSVRANIAMGLPADLIDDEAVWEALDLAHLGDFVRTVEGGLDAPVGERGLRLSGGQRQRIGVARALFTRPRLFVLDEATSALDAETERAITDILAGLKGVTTLIIAHRLSTVRNADLVVYLEDGRKLAAGSFEEVCAQVPAFQRQADLMGLRTR